MDLHLSLQPEVDWVIQQEELVGPQVYRILKERIVRADLTPGSLISESEIARTLELSRQPVREAFIKLAEEGLMEIRPQRGTMVRKISTAAVMDVRFVREAIEAEVVKQVAKVGDSVVIANLRRLLNHQQDVAANDHDQFMKLDEAFHRALAEAAGKPYAWKVIEGVKSQMDRVRYLSTLQFPFKTLIEQHKKIVDAVERRKPGEADRAIRMHLRQILKDLPDIEKSRPEFFEL